MLENSNCQISKHYKPKVIKIILYLHKNKQINKTEFPELCPLIYGHLIFSKMPVKLNSVKATESAQADYKIYMKKANELK